MRTKYIITFYAAFFGLIFHAAAYPQYGEQHPNVGGLLPSVITQNSSFDPLDGVLAYDANDGYLTNITVSGSVNTSASGEYTITYSVSNSSNDTKTIQRRITVIPAGTFAQITATGRTGKHNIITLDNSYIGTLATNLTYIEPVITALDGTDCKFKLIKHKWDNANYTNTPPTTAEWDAKKLKPFWHDLYLTIQPRQDRWLKIILSNNGHTNSVIYGLAGDPGVQFHSDLFNQDYYRLSREVDDPQTCGQQFTNAYANGLSFWAKADMPTLRKMGSRALSSTYVYMSDSYDAAAKSELYGFYTTERAFLKRASKDSSSTSNWARIEQIWDHTLSHGMNCSYRRSYEIFFAEVKISNYMANIRRILPRLRSDYNPKRIYVGCSNKGFYYDYINDTTKTNHTNNGTNDYFSFEWHKGHFSKMFDSFPGIGNNWPGFSQYPRINEVFDERYALGTFKEHRSLHKLAIDNHIEAAIFDKCNFTGTLKNGEWGPFALPFYAMWYNYDGYDYLNNGAYFKDDWDGDGLSNADEKLHGTNPFNADTDGDRLFDNHEIQFGLDPLDPSDADADNDGDRLSNFDEVNLTLSWQYTKMDENGNSPSLNPADPSDGDSDHDHDLFPIWFETQNGLNTADIHVRKDSRKGAFYWWLDAAQFSKTMIAMDTYILDLLSSDHDSDGINNDIEVQNGLNPRNSSDANEDWDNDGLSNSNEIANATSLVGDYTDAPKFDNMLVRSPMHALQPINAAPLHSSVTAPDTGKTQTFTKLSGPDWLTISNRGLLSGRPPRADIGTNTWQVTVADNTGRTDTNTLYIQILNALNIPEIGISCNSTNIPDNAPFSCAADFGTTSTDDYTEHIFTITNRGFANLKISSINIAGTTFSIPNQPATNIPFQASSQFSIRFQPAAATPIGISTGSIQIISNDQNQSPYTINLKGHVTPGSDFSPLSISNCVLWLDAADIDGDGISENMEENNLTNSNKLVGWNDKSGHDNNASAPDSANQPTLITRQLSNLSTINFDGTNDYISFNTITNIRTVFWVIKETPESTSEMNFLLGDTTTYDFHRGGSLNIWSGYANTAVRNGKTRLNGSIVNGQNTPIPSNQFCIISITTTNTVTASQFSKDRSNISRTWHGDLAEIIIYSTPLANNQINNIQQYIENKWHLNSNAPIDYNLWITNYNLGTQTNRNDDPDHDGISNFAEYATGSAPDQITTSRLKLIKHNSRSYDIIYRRRKQHARLGLHYILESSTNLLNNSGWLSNTTARIGIGSESAQIESVTNSPLDITKQAQFFRIRIKSNN
jgi:hypothetical protein